MYTSITNLNTKEIGATAAIKALNEDLASWCDEIKHNKALAVRRSVDSRGAPHASHIAGAK